MDRSENKRRRDLHLLLALGFLLFSLTALIKISLPAAGPALAPILEYEKAAYRPDGGQMLGQFYRLEPNALSRLNLGRRLDLTRTRPEFLAALPGLGPKSAVRARQRGCLTQREHRNLHNLVIEQCDPTKP